MSPKFYWVIVLSLICVRNVNNILKNNSMCTPSHPYRCTVHIPSQMALIVIEQPAIPELLLFAPSLLGSHPRQVRPRRLVFRVEPSDSPQQSQTLVGPALLLEHLCLPVQGLLVIGLKIGKIVYKVFYLVCAWVGLTCVMGVSLSAQ